MTPVKNLVRWGTGQREVIHRHHGESRVIWQWGESIFPQLLTRCLMWFKFRFTAFCCPQKPVSQNACSRFGLFVSLALFTLLVLQKMEDTRGGQIQPITYTDNNHPLNGKKKGSERASRKTLLENLLSFLRSSLSFHQRGISNAVCC